MQKKSPVVIALFLTLLLIATTYSQNADPSATAKPAKAQPDAPDYSGLPPGKIIDKLQELIIAWQDDIIKGMQDQPVVQVLYRDMVGVAVDTTTGEIKDKKILDLLSKYGISVATKDSKKLNTAGSDESFLKVTPAIAPFIEIKSGATREEKARIRDLLEKSQGMADKVTLSRKMVARLEIAAIDLLQLSKTDDGAQSLVTKYKIQQHATSSSPAP